MKNTAYKIAKMILKNYEVGECILPDANTYYKARVNLKCLIYKVQN